MAAESGVNLRKRKDKPRTESDDENMSENDSEMNEDSSLGSTSISGSISRWFLAQDYFNGLYKLFEKFW